MTHTAAGERFEVVIAGGGVAAVEAALALRRLAGSAVRTTLLSPGDELVYRPETVREPFDRPRARRYALTEIAADLGLELVHDALRDVDPSAHRLLTGEHGWRTYGALIVATGARPSEAVPRATTFLADRDPDALHWLVRDVEEDQRAHVAFVAPLGAGWTLPLYELALMTAERARDMSSRTRFTVITAEPAPLAAFHGEGSAAVAEQLAAAGIAVEAATTVRAYDGHTLELLPRDRRLEADAVVALPRLHGPAIGGLPQDGEGFVVVDGHGRVAGAPDVYAVGDAANFQLKQGGLATQEADDVAVHVARSAGIDVPEPSHVRTLRAILLTGGAPLYLSGEVVGGQGVSSTASREPLWSPPQKIAARELAPYLAALDERVSEAGTG